MRNPDATRFLFRLTGLLPLAAALVLIDWISFQPPARRHFTAPLDAAAHGAFGIRKKDDMVQRRHARPQTGLDRAFVRSPGSARARFQPLAASPPGVVRAAWRIECVGEMFAGDLADFVSIFFQMCVETDKTPQLVLLDLNPTLALEGKARVAPALAMHYRRALLRYGIFPPTFLSGLFSLDGLRWDPKIFLASSRLGDLAGNGSRHLPDAPGWKRGLGPDRNPATRRMKWRDP